MRAFIICFFDQTITDFASEHFNIIILRIITIKCLNLTVFRTEYLQFGRQVKAFQGHFGFDGMLKCLFKVFRSIENSAVINIGYIDA